MQMDKISHYILTVMGPVLKCKDRTDNVDDKKIKRVKWQWSMICIFFLRKGKGRHPNLFKHVQD